jgi:hypothetical protein
MTRTMLRSDTDREQNVEEKHYAFCLFVAPLAPLDAHNGLVSLRYPCLPLDPSLSSRRPPEKEDWCVPCSDTLESIRTGGTPCDATKLFRSNREFVVPSKIRAGTNETRIIAVDARDGNRHKNTHYQ